MANEIAVRDEQEGDTPAPASPVHEEADAVSVWLLLRGATAEEVNAEMETREAHVRAAATQGREREEAFLSLCENVRLIGDMVMDASTRLAEIERGFEDLNAKVDGTAVGGAMARSAWSQRR